MEEKKDKLSGQFEESKGDVKEGLGKASKAIVDGSAATLDQPVRVQDDDASGRELEQLLPVGRADARPER